MDGLAGPPQYSICTYIGVVAGVNVCKYAIDGVSGLDSVQPHARDVFWPSADERVTQRTGAQAVMSLGIVP